MTVLLILQTCIGTCVWLKPDSQPEQPDSLGWQLDGRRGKVAPMYDDEWMMMAVNSTNPSFSV
jgi:hypothetical protein